MTPVFISAFIRNDGAPALTMKAVIIGGCMNAFGDWLFVFPLGMGIAGAAAATLLMRYGDTTDLAVYGVIGTICALFQAIFRGVGQAIQPIVSANCGAGQTGRIKQTWTLSFGTVIVLGVVFTAAGADCPSFH